MLGFAATDECMEAIKQLLTDGNLPLNTEATGGEDSHHELSKLQRYAILRTIFGSPSISNEEK